MVSLYYDPNGEKVFSNTMSNKKEVILKLKLKQILQLIKLHIILRI